MPQFDSSLVICIGDAFLWVNLERNALIFGCSWLAIGIGLFIYKKLKRQNIVIGNAY